MTKYSGPERFVSLLFFAEGNKQFVYDTTTSDNTAIVECRQRFRSRKILESGSFTKRN
jgi:hypothetical protein